MPFVHFRIFSESAVLRTALLGVLEVKKNDGGRI